MTATFQQLSIDSCSDFLSFSSEILAFYEKGAKVPFSLLEKLHSHLQTTSFTSKNTFHIFLKNFLALALLQSSSQHSLNCDELFFHMKQQAIFYEPGIYKAYFPLIQQLLFKQETASCDLLSFDKFRFASLPLHYAEIGILSFLQGTLTHQSSDIQKGIDIAFSQLAYLDASGDFFKGAMRQEAQGCDQELYAVYSLLFSLASFFLPEEKLLADAYKELSQALEKMRITSNSQTFLFSLLQSFFQKQLSLQADLAEKKFDIPLQKTDRCLSFVNYFSLATQVLCSAQGDGLGFAFMKKHNVEFLSIGPQQGNLGEMNSYGISSNFHDKIDAHLIQVESSPKGFYFNAWLKCTDLRDDKPSKNWLHVCAVCENDGLDITVKSLNLFQEEELHLLFFVKADKVVVDQTFHLSPHTLDRYEGKVAPLKFYKHENPVVLESSLSSTMKVIPLSGEGHFWGAEFLVAYLLPQEESVSFQIN
jgi:hypothetical protein